MSRRDDSDSDCGGILRSGLFSAMGSVADKLVDMLGSLRSVSWSVFWSSTVSFGGKSVSHNDDLRDLSLKQQHLHT